MAAQLTLMNGSVPLRAAIVHGAGHQFLAGAGLARDQHRAARRRHQLDAPDQVHDRPARSDDSVRFNPGPDDRREHDATAVTCDFTTPPQKHC